MRNNTGNNSLSLYRHCLSLVRRYSRLAPPPPAYADRVVIRVSNNVAYLGSPKQAPLKPRQLLCLPPFPGYPLPARNSGAARITAVTWLKYYLDQVQDSAINSHFNKGLVCVESDDSCITRDTQMRSLRKIKHNEVMDVGARVWVPVSIAEARISKRFDCIPSGTLYPNADEIDYLRRLVKYKACLFC